MNRRWIHNDTPCRVREDADAGYECEVVDAAAYDRLQRLVNAIHAACEDFKGITPLYSRWQGIRNLAREGANEEVSGGTSSAGLTG